MCTAFFWDITVQQGRSSAASSDKKLLELTQRSSLARATLREKYYMRVKGKGGPSRFLDFRQRRDGL